MSKKSPAIASPGLSAKRKGSKMSLSKSKFLPPAEWKEIILSEDVLKDAILYAMSIRKMIGISDYIDKVIIGDAENGQYSLTVQIQKERG